MSFANVIAELQADLAGITATMLEQPPDSINQWPVLLIYPQPRAWTITARNNSDGELKYGGTHDIVVEWVTNYDNLARCIADATPIADAIPLALFTGFTADRFGGTVHHLHSVTCELFGPQQWDATSLFAVKFLVNVEIVETTG